MTDKYIILFKELAKNAELIAEQVADLNKKNNNNKGEETAFIMRNDFAKLADKINSKDFSPKDLTKAEYSRLFVAAFVYTNNLRTQMENFRKALQGYEVDLVPKLNRIITECKTDEEVNELAEKLFTISESK